MIISLESFSSSLDYIIPQYSELLEEQVCKCSLIFRCFLYKLRRQASLGCQGLLLFDPLDDKYSDFFVKTDFKQTYDGLIAKQEYD